MSQVLEIHIHHVSGSAGQVQPGKVSRVYPQKEAPVTLAYPRLDLRKQFSHQLVALCRRFYVLEPGNLAKQVVESFENYPSELISLPYIVVKPFDRRSRNDNAFGIFQSLDCRHRRPTRIKAEKVGNQMIFKGKAGNDRT